MIDIDNISSNIIDDLIRDRHAEYRNGTLHIKLYLHQELKDEDIKYYKYILLDGPIKTYSQCVHMFDNLKDHISSKVFFNIKFKLFDKIVSPKLYDNIFSQITPNFTLAHIVNSMKNNEYNGRDGINVHRKYIPLSSLRLPSKDILFYYFKKYLNQYIYNSESITPESPIITFNDKYIIDGKYSFMKQYIENPYKPIEIINIFNTSTPNTMKSFLNSQNVQLNNIKYVYDYNNNFDEDDILTTIKSNNLNDKSKIVINFDKLLQLHKNEY